MKKFTSKEIKEFVSKPHFDEKVILNKDSAWPKVSIVTPSYNQAQFLEQTILSILNQNYPNLEHIIIDGGSTDGSVEIIKKYEKYLAYWVSEKDKGQADAVNKGFKIAKGEIIGWLNSDDLYFDTRVITRVVRCFAYQPSVDVLYGDLALIDKSGLILKIDVAPGFSRSRLLRGCFIPQPAAFFRGHVTQKHCLNKDLHYFMDHDFFLRLSREYKFYHLRSVLAVGRHYLERKTVDKKEEMSEEHSEILQKHGQVFGVKYRVMKIWDIWITGIPRRIKELIKTLMLSLSYDFAFPVKLDNRWTRFKNLTTINTDRLIEKHVCQSSHSEER